MDERDPREQTESYVDGIFGAGAGQKHLRFLERIQNAGLREQVLRYHALEADTTHLSLEENYLIGLAVLAALGRHDTATMFAKTLLHLGTPQEKLLETVARLSMWIGGLPAVEATFRVQRAIKEYEREGLGSLAVWLPEGGEP
jgi:alkylhydroperoxidase/carboxymuconolactone decarboxylase family protein YurZ